MRAVLCASLLCCLPLSAQVPASTPEPAKPPQPATAPSGAHETAQPPKVEDSDVGFSYSLPADWQFVPPAPVPKVIVPYPDAVAAPKGDGCVQVVFTARRGVPASAVVVTELSFACYGEIMAAGDLVNLGAGAAEGLKQTFVVAEPVQGRYTLGKHAVWIERAKGVPKAHPADSYTFETACTILAKGAVCWTTMAADAASLQSFERSPVTLEGESFAALVPANALLPKP